MVIQLNNFNLPNAHCKRNHSATKQLDRYLAASLVGHQNHLSSLNAWPQLSGIKYPLQPVQHASICSVQPGNNASVQIEVNPRQPNVLPKCTFLGADHVTNPLKEKLCKNLHQWSRSTSLLHNLQHVLDINFPSPANTKKEDLSVECGICYAYRLAGCVPELTCDDPRCRQTFHRDCLYEWLRSVPTSRLSFNMVFGECPYCSKAITMKAPNK
ncbi:E3 ubiquitin-protein ligase FANCL [Lamellibrachia satsuma]|nr:E3 ubiquitin-protein ligase FANCL [Lamellibrachia satsuma]